MKSIKRMFLVISIIMIYLFTATVFAEQKIQDKPLKGLKLKIKTAYEFKEKFGKYEKERDYVFSIKYDEKGNEIETKYENISSTDISRYENKYDEKGNLIEVIKYIEDGLDKRSTFKYDEKGNLSEMERFERLNSYWKNIYKYNERGNPLEIYMYHKSYYDDEVKLNSTHMYTYSKNGSLIEHSVLLSDGSRIVITYEYDKREKLIRRLSRNWESETITEYNDKENPVKDSTTYSSEHVAATEHTYKYDKNNNLIEETKYEYRYRFGKKDKIPQSQTIIKYVF